MSKKLETEIQTIDDSHIFEPSQISIDLRTISVEETMMNISRGRIIVNQEFSKQYSNIFEAKSNLIESTLIGIPLPMFYVISDRKERYTVVDGLFRLNTIYEFTKSHFDRHEIKADEQNFKLQDLEYLKEYNQCEFSDLPTFLKYKLLETPLSYSVISPSLDEKIKRDIVKRIKYSDKLNEQGIRDLVYSGKSTQFLKELSSNQYFKMTTGLIYNQNRFEIEELILRFLSYAINNNFFNNDYENDEDSILSQTMLKINSLSKSSENEGLRDNYYYTLRSLKVDFETGILRSYKIFGINAFRRINRDPHSLVNKSLFELSIAHFSKLDVSQFDMLLRYKKQFIQDYYNLLKDELFCHFITVNTLSRDVMKEKNNLFHSIIYKYV